MNRRRPYSVAMRLGVLLLMAAALSAQEAAELEFDKKAVDCEPIECEVRIPTGWKVAQDHTGISAQGAGMGFVITREPLLEDEKEFAAKWQDVMAKARRSVEVKRVRAGRYKAFHAAWEASGRKIDVYRVHVPDQGMLYNVSFSALPDAPQRDALIQGVLKSFKCTAKKPKLQLAKQRVVVGPATMQLPEGYEEKKDRFWRGGRYVSMRKGYDKPEEIGVIYTATFPVGLRLPTGGMTSDPEAANKYLVTQLSQRGLKIAGKTKTKSASYAGMKGALTTGEVTGTEGETYGFYLWTGKGKRATATVAMLIHERELRVHRKYFSTVLKTLKASK